MNQELYTLLHRSQINRILLALMIDLFYSPLNCNDHPSFPFIVNCPSQNGRKMEIKLDEEKIKLLIEKTQIYVRDEFDESIGELKAGFLVDFFIKEVGPQIYNQAISDAYLFMQDKLIDLESTLYAPE